MNLFKIIWDNLLYEEDKDQVNIIDFEYQSPNPAAFDIAEHFNEYSGLNVRFYNIIEPFITEVNGLQGWKNSCLFPHIHVRPGPGKFLCQVGLTDAYPWFRV